MPIQVVPACIGQLRAERASLTAGTEQSKAEPDIWAARIRWLEAAEVTCNGELGVLSQTVRLLEAPVTALQDRENTAEDLACKMLNMMSELLALVEVQTRTVSGALACVSASVGAELVRIQSGTTQALLESGATVIDPICDCVTASQSNGNLNRMIRWVMVDLTRLSSYF